MLRDRQSVQNLSTGNSRPHASATTWQTVVVNSKMLSRRTKQKGSPLPLADLCSAVNKNHTPCGSKTGDDPNSDYIKI